MALKNPPVGPVLGLTTSESARFMAGIQNKIPKSKAKDKMNCGWIRLRRSEAKRWGAPKRFRFNRNFYYTGVIEIRGLESATEYEYQLGFKSDYSETDTITASEWKGVQTYSFYTQGTDKFHFCFGSCLRNGGDSRAGKVLGHVANIHKEAPLNMMLWLGDQVYNDPFWRVTPDNSSRENFFELYGEFFSIPNIRNILPKIPNYMVMDDHEIYDNYSDKSYKYLQKVFNFVTGNNEKIRLINGLTAFCSYQASYGGLLTTEKDRQDNVYFVKGEGKELNQSPSKYYYQVDMGEVGLFLMDTRQERSKGKLISDRQEQELFQFLLENKYRVKLIASAVTFLADAKDKSDDDNEYEHFEHNNHEVVNDDNWKRASEQRAKILDFIDDNSIKNVIFLSGDVHAHFAAQLLKGGKNTTIYQLVSSSLFWPCGGKIFRWGKGDVAFEEPIYLSSQAANYPSFKKKKYTLSDALSNTDYRFHSDNGVGYVSIGSDSFEFKVLNHKGEAVIKVELPLA